MPRQSNAETTSTGRAGPRQWRPRARRVRASANFLILRRAGPETRRPSTSRAAGGAPKGSKRYTTSDGIVLVVTQ